MSSLEKALLATCLLIYGFLAVFSYAYVDLNLTLSKNQLINAFVGVMQQLGYFHRPQATAIYLMFLIFAFSFFILNLWLFYRKKISQKYLKVATVANTLILILAYPFLSSDLFNYLFDAKIILKYHLSPYTHRALDFPQDEWIRFMRWVHRYSPYGPLWLGMSIIPAALGFGKFILNFLTFKIFIGTFHLINSLLIYKTLKVINPKFTLIGTSFYALNPLFLIEGVANAHNDLILATFLILPAYFLAVNKKIWAIPTILAGVFIKYIPLLNFPWVIWHLFAKRKNLASFIWLNLATMALFTYLYSSFRITVPFVSSGATQVQFQPWYLFWTLPFVAILVRFDLIVIATSLAFGALLRYLPYLYFGDWSQPATINFMTAVTLAPLILTVVTILIKKISARDT